MKRFVSFALNNNFKASLFIQFVLSFFVVKEHNQYISYILVENILKKCESTNKSREVVVLWDICILIRIFVVVFVLYNPKMNFTVNPIA